MHACIFIYLFTRLTFKIYKRELEGNRLTIYSKNCLKLIFFKQNFIHGFLY